MMAFFSLIFVLVMSGSNGIPSPSISSSKGGFLILLRPPFTCHPPSCALAPIITRINTLLLVYAFQTLTELFLHVFLPTSSMSSQSFIFMKLSPSPNASLSSCLHEMFETTDLR
jgi:hypothetical protein